MGISYRHSPDFNSPFFCSGNGIINTISAGVHPGSHHHLQWYPMWLAGTSQGTPLTGTAHPCDQPNRGRRCDRRHFPWVFTVTTRKGRKVLQPTCKRKVQTSPSSSFRRVAEGGWGSGCGWFLSSLWQQTCVSQGRAAWRYYHPHSASDPQVNNERN